MSQRDHHSARPLSPHLQIWRWGPHMLVSILHRVSGSAMALVGLPLLVWFLGALASGPEAFATFTFWMGSPIGLVVLFGLSWAFFNHMMSGLRHFVLDIGAGYDLDVNRFWSIASPVIGVLLTLALWSYLLFAKGA
ncbi:succinate dehydrogenase, cytochrome b556 subunit [Erythrobacter sp.]|uniref:succinate dehydrogenase, cytochrome b556 subunit n=1 Tax=Erythrobacter sp. TaxID=1042 RepID=UPI001425EAD6|nr:succinate dehydrogenase, cytochrome b556 subunit [Erythrobacter sp.]QIQ85909.1 MAG: succinate dehydrogenase, cytochrome b556 subunit [Erythrobacter sp.]